MAKKEIKKIIDPIHVCIYCGDLMDGLTEEQIKRFGTPTCCEFPMLTIEREKIHTIVRSIDKLKSNLEKELLKGVMEL